MTEYNIFCYSKEYNSDTSFKQKRFRIFNVEITEEEFKNINTPSINLEFDKNESYLTRYETAFKKAWDKLTKEEKKKFTDLPHFNAEIFEEITGVKVNEIVEEITMEELEKELGRKVKIINLLTK